VEGTQWTQHAAWLCTCAGAGQSARVLQGGWGIDWLWQQLWCQPHHLLHKCAQIHAASPWGVAASLRGAGGGLVKSWEERQQGARSQTDGALVLWPTLASSPPLPLTGRLAEPPLAPTPSLDPAPAAVTVVPLVAMRDEQSALRGNAQTRRMLQTSPAPLPPCAYPWSVWRCCPLCFPLSCPLSCSLCCSLPWSSDPAGITSCGPRHCSREGKGGGGGG
jgi:hypothetical protein